MYTPAEHTLKKWVWLTYFFGVGASAILNLWNHLMGWVAGSLGEPDYHTKKSGE